MKTLAAALVFVALVITQVFLGPLATEAHGGPVGHREGVNVVVRMTGRGSATTRAGRPGQTPEELATSGRLILKQVLARREFRPQVEPWYARVLDRVLQPLISALAAVVALVELAPVQILIALLATVLLIFGARPVSRLLGKSRAFESTLVDGDAAEASISSLDLRRRAQESSRAGHYRAGIRYLYLAFLADTAARGFVELRHDRTNWEYLRQIRATGPQALSTKAASLTRVFELKWYGGQGCDREDYDAFRSLCNS